MSVIKANKHQIGSNATASKNIVLEANTDGDLVISKGVHDGTLTEVLKVKNSGGIDSSAVGYQPAGTGAVATTVQSKLRERVSAKDFGAVGDQSTSDKTAIQSALSSLTAQNGQTLYRNTGSRISVKPAYTATGVVKFEDLTWPYNATVQYNGPSYEQVNLLNNFSTPYNVIGSFTAAVPVNEFQISAPYHPGIVLDVKTKASYNNVVQPAHQFQLDYAAAGATFDSSEQGSINWRKDGASTWSLVYGENKTNNLVFHQFAPSQQLYRLHFGATYGDVGVQTSSPQYPLDVPGKMRLFQDVSTNTPVQGDNRTRFPGRPSFILEYKNNSVDNVSTIQLEGSTGYQVGVNAPNASGVTASVQLTAGNGSGVARAVLLDGFYNSWTPAADNSTALGLASSRWSTVYAGTGTINTSDEREKQDIADLDAAEKRVAVALKGLVKKFRFKDAVASKGDVARIHVGVIAQEVVAAFQAEGLDPMRYAIVCYDEWAAKLDDEGNEIRPAGNRYGVRYEELLAFIIAAL